MRPLSLCVSISGCRCQLISISWMPIPDKVSSTTIFCANRDGPGVYDPARQSLVPIVSCPTKNFSPYIPDRCFPFEYPEPSPHLTGVFIVNYHGVVSACASLLQTGGRCPVFPRAGIDDQLCHPGKFLASGYPHEHARECDQDQLASIKED